MFSKIIRDLRQYLPLPTIKSTALDSSNSLPILSPLPTKLELTISLLMTSSFITQAQFFSSVF